LWIEYELFPWLPGLVEVLGTARRAPYLVDYDDAIFHRYDRHPNPLIRTVLGGKIDGVMRRAALVVVGNEYLYDRAVAAGAQRVEILPTSIDLARYVPSESVSHDPFTIGWIGSPATTRYLDQVHGALAEFCAHRQAQVVLVGASDPGWQDVPYRCHPWSEATEVTEIGRFDVGIMPLEDSPWERGKCGYKLIQYMACGKPVIASPVGVNARIVEPGINGYLAESKEDWLQALTALIGDAGLRRQMGTNGRVKVERKFTIQVNGSRLVAMLRAVAGQDPCAA
jgi:glycosyltransferase involved in cell wall biosynthesis